MRYYLRRLWGSRWGRRAILLGGVVLLCGGGGAWLRLPPEIVARQCSSAANALWIGGQLWRCGSSLAGDFQQAVAFLDEKCPEGACEDDLADSAKTPEIFDATAAERLLTLVKGMPSVLQPETLFPAQSAIPLQQGKAVTLTVVPEGTGGARAGRVTLVSGKEVTLVAKLDPGGEAAAPVTLTHTIKAGDVPQSILVAPGQGLTLTLTCNGPECLVSLDHDL